MSLGWRTIACHEAPPNLPEASLGAQDDIWPSPRAMSSTARCSRASRPPEPSASPSLSPTPPSGCSTARCSCCCAPGRSGIAATESDFAFGSSDRLERHPSGVCRARAANGILFLHRAVRRLRLSAAWHCRSDSRRLAWIGVAIAAAVVMSAINARIVVPQATPMERALVWLCFVATLGRCILLGVFGRGAATAAAGPAPAAARFDPHAQGARQVPGASVNLELKRQATHDALTGIANRVLFVEHLEHAVRERQPFAVCVFDLDRFKIINDSLGPWRGRCPAQARFRAAALDHPLQRHVARAGGDEFLLLLRNVGSARKSRHSSRAGCRHCRNPIS